MSSCKIVGNIKILDFPKFKIYVFFNFLQVIFFDNIFCHEIKQTTKQVNHCRDSPQLSITTFQNLPLQTFVTLQQSFEKLFQNNILQ